MTNVTTEPAVATGKAEVASSRADFLAISLMSFSALLLELALTRVFSVVLYYHFAFLAISIALLGLGAGGVFAYLRRGWLERWTINQLGPVLCCGNALIIVLVLEVVLHSAISMHPDWLNFRRLTVLYLVSAVPFFITGLFFSLFSPGEPAQISQFYGADLLGGALACLALVPLLEPATGGPNVVLFAAVVVALAGAAPGAADAAVWRSLAVALLLLVLDLCEP